MKKVQFKGETFPKKLVKSCFCLFGEFFEIWRQFDWLTQLSNQSQASKIQTKMSKRHKFDLTRFLEFFVKKYLLMLPFFIFRALCKDCIRKNKGFWPLHYVSYVILDHKVTQTY